VHLAAAVNLIIVKILPSWSIQAILLRFLSLGGQAVEIGFVAYCRLVYAYRRFIFVFFL
jgi:hypothetical protein